MVKHDLQYLKIKLPDQVRNLIYICPLGNISEDKFQQYANLLQKNEYLIILMILIEKCHMLKLKLTKK